MAVNTKVTVNVPGRSSFDKSFKNILTTKVGSITPICSRLVIPGSKGSLKLAISACLPPLASDTFMRCNLKVEAFLVPMRLLYGGFEAWLTQNKLYVYSSNSELIPNLPRLVLQTGSTFSAELANFGPGSLADFLGIRISPAATDPLANSYFNVMKFLAYHRCYDDWYRNPKVNSQVFRAPVGLNQTSNAPLSAMPFIATGSPKDFKINDTFVDGVALGSLRQRNFDDDYFTVASPSAQWGTAQSVTVSSNQFTIAALRSANSLQQYSERTNLGSPRLQDFVKSHYGADLSSGVAQRAILLGSASYPVYSKGVDANSANAATNNPFTTVGAQYGRGYASGSDLRINFEANEPSYLMVMATLVPEANYSSGIEKEASMFITANASQVDLPDPLLENVGNEPIYDAELTGRLNFQAGNVFGYVPRYTAHKSALNQVHGLMRDGQSLASFVAQRTFSNYATLTQNASFLRIPTSALNNVTAVTADLSNYGCWIDSYIDLKVSEPLTECAMPSLQDPAYEHGKKVRMSINGSKV